MNVESYNSDSIFGCSLNSQKTTKKSLSPATRAASDDDEERSSSSCGGLFSVSEDGDKEDMEFSKLSMKC